MGGEVPGVPPTQDEQVTEEDLLIAGRDHRKRVGLVARMMARDPMEDGPAKTANLAKQFGVTERTIKRDKHAIRAACGEKAENAIETVGETIARLDELWEGAIRDCDRVGVDSNVRAAHRNTAMRVLELRANTLFRLGYWTEVPRKVQHSGDEANPVRASFLLMTPDEDAAVTKHLDALPEAEVEPDAKTPALE